MEKEGASLKTKKILSKPKAGSIKPQAIKWKLQAASLKTKKSFKA